MRYSFNFLSSPKLQLVDIDSDAPSYLIHKNRGTCYKTDINIIMNIHQKTPTMERRWWILHDNSVNLKYIVNISFVAFVNILYLTISSRALAYVHIMQMPHTKRCEHIIAYNVLRILYVNLSMKITEGITHLSTVLESPSENLHDIILQKRHLFPITPLRSENFNCHIWWVKSYNC